MEKDPNSAVDEHLAASLTEEAFDDEVVELEEAKSPTELDHEGISVEARKLKARCVELFDQILEEAKKGTFQVPEQLSDIFELDEDADDIEKAQVLLFSKLVSLGLINPDNEDMIIPEKPTREQLDALDSFAGMSLAVGGNLDDLMRDSLFCKRYCDIPVEHQLENGETITLTAGEQFFVSRAGLSLATMTVEDLESRGFDREDTIVIQDILSTQVAERRIAGDGLTHSDIAKLSELDQETNQKLRKVASSVAIEAIDKGNRDFTFAELLQLHEISEEEFMTSPESTALLRDRALELSKTITTNDSIFEYSYLLDDTKRNKLAQIIGQEACDEITNNLIRNAFQIIGADAFIESHKQEVIERAELPSAGQFPYNFPVSFTAQEKAKILSRLSTDDARTIIAKLKEGELSLWGHDFELLSLIPSEILATAEPSMAEQFQSSANEPLLKREYIKLLLPDNYNPENISENCTKVLVSYLHQEMPIEPTPDENPRDKFSPELLAYTDKHILEILSNNGGPLSRVTKVFTKEQLFEALYTDLLQSNNPEILKLLESSRSYSIDNRDVETTISTLALGIKSASWDIMRLLGQGTSLEQLGLPEDFFDRILNNPLFDKKDPVITNEILRYVSLETFMDFTKINEKYKTFLAIGDFDFKSAILRNSQRDSTGEQLDKALVQSLFDSFLTTDYESGDFPLDINSEQFKQIVEILDKQINNTNLSTIERIISCDERLLEILKLPNETHDKIIKLRSMTTEGQRQVIEICRECDYTLDEALNLSNKEGIDFDSAIKEGRYELLLFKQSLSAEDLEKFDIDDRVKDILLAQRELRKQSPTVAEIMKTKLIQKVEDEDGSVIGRNIQFPEKLNGLAHIDQLYLEATLSNSYILSSNAESILRNIVMSGENPEIKMRALMKTLESDDISDIQKMFSAMIMMGEDAARINLQNMPESLESSYSTPEFKTIIMTDLLRSELLSGSRSLREFLLRAVNGGTNQEHTAKLLSYANNLGLGEIRSAAELLELMDRLVEERHERHIESIQKGEDGKYRLRKLPSPNDLAKGIRSDYFYTIFDHGYRCPELLGEETKQDITHLDVDFGLIRSGESLDMLLQSSISEGYGEQLYAVIYRDERFEADVKSPDLTKRGIVEKTERRIEGFGGVRSSIGQLDVDFYVIHQAQRYSKPVRRLIHSIILSGVYTPVVDRETEEVIFTPEDFEEERRKMRRKGISRFDKKRFDAESMSDIPAEEDVEIELSEETQIPDSLLHAYGLPSMQEMIAGFEDKRRENAEQATIVENAIIQAIEQSDLPEDIKERFRHISHGITTDLSRRGLDSINTGSTGRDTNVPHDADVDLMWRLDRKTIAYASQIQQILSSVFQNMPSIGTLSVRKAHLIAGETDIEVDITPVMRGATIRESTDMVLASRLSKIEAQDPERYREIIANIVLAKQIMKEAECYKSSHSNPAQGGLGGIGIENWILQNRGSLIEAARSFVEAATNPETGEMLSFDEFTKRYEIWDYGENIMHERTIDGRQKQSAIYPYDELVTNNMDASGYEKMLAACRKIIQAFEQS